MKDQDDKFFESRKMIISAYIPWALCTIDLFIGRIMPTAM